MGYKKRMHGKHLDEKARTMAQEERFSMNEIIDVILIQLNDRIENSVFLSGQSLEQLSNEELKSQAVDLAVLYKNYLSQDEFPTEVVVFRDHLSETNIYSHLNTLDLLTLLRREVFLLLFLM